MVDLAGEATVGAAGETGAGVGTSADGPWDRSRHGCEEGGEFVPADGASPSERARSDLALRHG